MRRTRFDSRLSIPALKVPETPDYTRQLEAIESSGAQVAEAFGNFAKQYSAVKSAEAQAMRLIPDADFTADSGPNSIFAHDAKELMRKVQGGVEGAYNFANPNEVERFNMDLANLKKEMEEFEPLYDEAVKGLQGLEQQHDLFMKVGGDPKQAATERVGGVDYYNAKAGAVEFDETIGRANALRYGQLQTDPITGKITLTDESGNMVAEYGSKQEYLQDIVQLAKPDLQPVPVVPGAEFARDEKWATQFDTESKAESAALSYVLNNPAVAERRAREVMGVNELAPQGEMSPEAEAMLAKHPKSSARFDELSDAQLAYVNEIMQGWRDTKKSEKLSKPTATQTAKEQERKRKKSSAMQSIRVVGDDTPKAVFSGGLFEAVVGEGNIEPGMTVPGNNVTFPYSFNDTIQVRDDEGNELDLKVTQFSYDASTDKIELRGTTSKSSAPGEAETIVDKRVSIDGANIEELSKLNQLLGMEYDISLAKLFRKFAAGEYQKAPSFTRPTTQEEVNKAMGYETEGATPKGAGLADLIE